MHCSSCGKKIADGSSFCPECGAQQNKFAQPPQQQYSTAEGTRDQVRRSNLVYPKNPPLSPHLALLALIQPGIPHIVFGQVAKGIVLILAFWLSLPTGIGPLVILVASVIDAYKVGYALKLGKTVKKWAFFPNA